MPTKYQWKGFWPLAVWPGVLWLLNPDLFLIPALKAAGMRFELVTLVATVVALVDLFYTIWCWSATWRRLAEVKEVRELRRRRSVDGWVDRNVIDLLITMYHQAIEPDGRLERALKRVGGRRVLYLACASPLPGPRTATAIYCGVRGAQTRCVLTLTVCDIIHVIGVSYFWELVFWVARRMMGFL